MTEADKWTQLRKAKALLELSKEEKLPAALQEQLIALTIEVLKNLIGPQPQKELFPQGGKETEYPD